jgi:hypothetical protein
VPNTLAHIGVQATLNMPVRHQGMLSWVLLACLIPDIPWMLKRILNGYAFVDPFGLHIYTTVQASLALSALLSLAFALFAGRILLVWLLLSVNCALHLLLDAIEIKPGNGVHLFAPFSWERLRFEWVWPEHWLVTAWTTLGFVVLAVIVLSLAAGRKLPAPELSFTRRRVCGALGIVFIYLTLPLTLLYGPVEEDTRRAALLRNPEYRPGEHIVFDRDRIFTRDGQSVLITSHGVELELIGDGLPESGIVSIEGRFADEHTVEVSTVHVNRAAFRDWASILGIALVVGIWARHLSSHFGRRASVGVATLAEGRLKSLSDAPQQGAPPPTGRGAYEAHQTR